MPAPARRAGIEVLHPPAGRAYRRPRHFLLGLSLLLLVLLPAAGAAAYLWLRAADQYASTLGFVVRQEEGGGAVALFGGLTSMAGGASSDTEVLYEFLRSQALVARADRALDLRGRFAAPFSRDPVFAFDPEGSIEDLLHYWRRMVRVHHDATSGLVEVEVRAFTAGSARDIAAFVLEESREMINGLSVLARTDATRHAKDELEQAMQRARAARSEMAAFRARTRIIDPAADIRGRMGLLESLQHQLATALVEGEVLARTTGAGDPRLARSARRIAVIEDRIAQERAGFAEGGTAAQEDYVAVLGEFERLTVENEFAEQAYLAARAAYDAAVAEARRDSRYLAAFVGPTLAERAIYPRRYTIGLATFAFLLAVWVIGVLMWYSLRDRR
ncbi:MAG: hypothetical protein CML55_05990 [Rhodobacteraceae bacterium]|nr:hypothetical protein [Paracoccaceae bacterium]